LHIDDRSDAKETPQLTDKVNDAGAFGTVVDLELGRGHRIGWWSVGRIAILNRPAAGNRRNRVRPLFPFVF